MGDDGNFGHNTCSGQGGWGYAINKIPCDADALQIVARTGIIHVIHKKILTLHCLLSPINCKAQKMS